MMLKAIHNRARAIAIALNEVDEQNAWTSRPAFEHSAYLIREDGLTITMRRFHSVIDRIEFLPHYPKPETSTQHVHSFYGERKQWSEIALSLAESREDISIARSLLTKFLPKYEPAHAYVIGVNAERDALVTRTRNVRDILLAHVPHSSFMTDHDNVGEVIFTTLKTVPRIVVFDQRVQFDVRAEDSDAALAALLALRDAEHKG